jgi:hypothetical protein
VNAPYAEATSEQDEGGNAFWGFRNGYVKDFPFKFGREAADSIRKAVVGVLSDRLRVDLDSHSRGVENCQLVLGCSTVNDECVSLERGQWGNTWVDQTASIYKLYRGFSASKLVGCINCY